MALGDLLGGFGQGLGAAAAGYGAGQVRGEAERYRRGQIEEDREYKKALLALQKAKIKTERERPTLGMETAAKLIPAVAAKLTDEKTQQFIRDHPEYGTFLNKLSGHLIDVQAGRAELDPRQLNFLQKFEQDVEGGGMAAPGGAAPAPGSAPAPGPPGGGPLAGLLAPAPPALGGVRAAAAPPSATLGSRVMGALPGGVASLLQARSAPPARAAAPAPPPEPAVPTRDSVLRDIAAIRARKPPTKGAYQTDEDYRRDLAQFENDRSRDMTTATQLMTAIPKSEEAATKAAAAPDVIQSNLAKTRAATTYLEQRTAESKALLKPKVREIFDRIRKRKADTAQAERRLTETERANRARTDVAWYNAETARLRQQDTAAWYAAQKDKAQFLMDRIDDPNKRAALAAAVRVLTATRDITEDPAFNEQQLEAAAEQVDDISLEFAGRSLGLSKNAPKGGGTPAPRPAPSPTPRLSSVSRTTTTRGGRGAAGANDMITVTHEGRTYTVSRSKLKSQGWSDPQIEQFRSRNR